MCIVALAWQVLADTPLCLLSNRDEFYRRPTAALAAWSDSPIVAGQDLESGGTWMGITPAGRWAVPVPTLAGLVRPQDDAASAQGRRRRHRPAGPSR